MDSWSLADIPAAAFQALLSHLSPGDYASLRQVSRSVSKHTNQHIPYITLHLSNTSSKQQLQQWCRATRQLQQVASVQIIIVGRISTEIFDQAMHLLSEHTSLTQLQLLSNKDYLTDIGSITHRAWIPSLQPIVHILQRLETLVLGDVFLNMAGELKILAVAVAAQKIQPAVKTLVLTASWPSPRYARMLGELHWLEFIPALHHLAAAFPRLTDLKLRHPYLKFVPLVASGESDPLGDFGSADAAEAELAAAYYPPGSKVDYRRVQLVQVAAVAALANTVQQLKQLQSLEITNFIDIWQDEPSVLQNYDVFTDRVPSAIVAAEAAPAAAVAVVDAALEGGLIPSVSEAVAAFRTLDEFACWLLQQHPTLKLVKIKTSESGLGMSWQRQQQLLPGHSCCSSAQVELSNVEQYAQLIACQVDEASYDSERHQVDPVRLQDESNNDSSSSSDDGDYPSLATRFCSDLSQYSFRPASSFLDHINSCKLELYHYEADDLGPLLGDLRSLKHLQITLRRSQADANTPPDDTDIRKAIAAAAVVEGLQSLTIKALYCRLSLAGNLLLPLTAAAEGPGSSLQKLKMEVVFSTVAAEAAATAQAEVEAAADPEVSLEGNAVQQRADGLAALATPDAEETTLTIDQDGADTTAMGRNAAAESSSRAMLTEQDTIDGPPPPAAAPDQYAAPTWHSALQQLGGLRQLIIVNHSSSISAVKLPVESLPASLKVLECRKVNLMSIAVAAGVDAAASTPCLPAVVYAGCAARLQTLHLDVCQLSRPNILASDQLQQLTLDGSSWPGGCAAAAAAWPNVQKLTWQFRDESCAVGSCPRQSLPAGILQTVMRIFGGSNNLVKLPLRAGSSTGMKRISVPCFAEIADGFKHLKWLGVLKLPWLSVELLQPVAQKLREVQHMDLVLNPHMYGSQARLETSVLKQDWMRDPYDTHTVVLHPDIRKVQQWLEQQVPWVRVVIELGVG